MEIALEDTGMVLGLWPVGQFLTGRNKQENLGPIIGDQENQSGSRNSGSLLEIRYHTEIYDDKFQWLVK